MISLDFVLLPPSVQKTVEDFKTCWWCDSKTVRSEPFPWPHNPQDYVTEHTYVCGTRLRIKDVKTYGWLIACMQDEPEFTDKMLELGL